MYHAIDPTSNRLDIVDPGEKIYAIDEREFRRQMKHLSEEGYHTICAEDFMSWRSGIGEIPDKCILITFDDGHATNISKGLPILQEYNFRADFFITTGFVGKSNFLTRENILTLRRAGMGIGSHTVTHAMLNDLDIDSIRVELADSKEYLENLLGENVVTLSVPGGRISKIVRKIAKEVGYEAIFTSHTGMNDREANLFSVKRITVRQGTKLTNRLLSSGYVGGKDYILQGALDLAKIGFGNKLYDQLRKSILCLSRNRLRRL
ncbi:MAG: polysaccharide deacetylase family protein [Deltaproteobacteria bacterium]|nr:polysaccharide deacetylase family protein [Deltaproteobacteria bacterium]